MSLTHALLGALTENSRFRILGTTGKLKDVLSKPSIAEDISLLLEQCKAGAPA